MQKDEFTCSLSRQDADLISQALDVYAATLMCAPLGFGLGLLGDVRALRNRLKEASGIEDALREAVEDPDTNVVIFARA